MRVVMPACLVLAGCSFSAGSSPADAPAIDDAIDAPMRDAPDAACESYSTLFDSCTTAMGSSALTLTPGAWEYNTDTHMLSGGSSVTIIDSKTLDLAAGPLDTIFVSSFTVQAGATLRVVGPMQGRAFGIAASGPVRIDGIIDVSSGGAGARALAACGTQVGGIGDNNGGGAGGGGGGASRGAGGGGGPGDLDGTLTMGASGGIAVMRPASPIGGCPGGTGGTGNGMMAGLGGDAGGALYIASGTSIIIGANGILDAGGHGGFEANGNGDAGGGGGAGGMILLESKLVTVDGIVVANGGGGGEGNTNGEPGENGQRSTAKAKGGKGGDSSGGDGGDGGSAGTLAGETTTDLRNGGGGGGGGGVGFIAIGCPMPTTSAGTISPSFATWP